MADLKLHSHEIDLEEAMRYCIECAPKGWLLDNGSHVRYEMQTTLHFVGWHIGMVMGKVQFIKFLTDRAEQLGNLIIGPSLQPCLDCVDLWQFTPVL